MNNMLTVVAYYMCKDCGHKWKREIKLTAQKGDVCPKVDWQHKYPWTYPYKTEKEES